jgi:antitoxin (DNA-binding transcriptional repressor) of toxin-antitoxin stability system
MNPVTIAEAAEQLSDLIDAALRGEEVIITKGDRTFVKLTPTAPVKPRQLINIETQKLITVALLHPKIPQTKEIYSQLVGRNQSR